MPTKKQGPRYYAVVRGRKPGVYHTWDDAERQVSGFRQAQHKSFRTMAEAIAYLRASGVGG